MFARVIPAEAAGGVSILVQFSAALVAFGTKGTVEAVAAHEFTHYVDLVRRLSTKNVLSDETEESLYGMAVTDPGRTVPPKLIFADKALVSLVSRKFKDVLADPSLNKKVEQEWVAKGLPVRWVDPSETVARIRMGSVAAARFDPRVLEKVASIERKLER